MAVFKVEKNKNFTIMSNYHLQDKRLSLKAKGLLSYMFSLPEDWDYSLNGLVAICKEQERAIKSTLSELKEKGYLVIEKNRNNKGYFEYKYLIYEIPRDFEKNNPEVHNPPVDKREVENDTQINTNKQNTNKQTDKGDKTNLPPFFVAEEHNILTLELIKREYINEEDTQIYYYDKLFNELLEEKSYQDLLCIIHYIIPRVQSRGFKDEDGNIIENKFGYLKASILSNIRLLNFDYDSLWSCSDFDDDNEFSSELWGDDDIDMTL